MHTLLIALALMLVLEGALYALFPDGMQRMMRQMIQSSPESLRKVGLGLAFAGLVLMYLLQR